MRRFRTFRKDSIFRLYLALFTLATAFGMIAVVRAQGSANRRTVSFLEKRIAELESRPVTIPSAPPSHEVMEVPAETPSPPPFSPYTATDLFWIEGTGFNKRYAYLDLVFFDGYRARYYFRPYPDSDALADLHRRISHDALCHYSFPLDNDDDS